MLSVASPLAHTLANIHQRRILHRSVKPENIAFGISCSTDVFLLDFGMAALGLRDAAGARRFALCSGYSRVLKGALSRAATRSVRICVRVASSIVCARTSVCTHTRAHTRRARAHPQLCLSIHMHYTSVAVGDLTGPPRDMTGRTAMFASVRAQCGWRAGSAYRASDDLEALCFVLLYLHLGGLPWQDKPGDEMLAGKRRLLDWLATAPLDSEWGSGPQSGAAPPPPEAGFALAAGSGVLVIFRMLKQLAAISSEVGQAVAGGAYAIFEQPVAAPHPRRDWAHPRPHLRRDRARRCPHLRPDWARRCPHLRRDWGPLSGYICAGTCLPPAHLHTLRFEQQTSAIEAGRTAAIERGTTNDESSPSTVFEKTKDCVGGREPSPSSRNPREGASAVPSPTSGNPRGELLAILGEHGASLSDAALTAVLSWKLS